MTILTVDEILDRWGPGELDALARDVSDEHVWLFALMATAIAGKRAQTQGLEKYEEACAEFSRILGEALHLDFDEIAGSGR